MQARGRPSQKCRLAYYRNCDMAGLRSNYIKVRLRASIRRQNGENAHVMEKSTTIRLGALLALLAGLAWFKFSYEPTYEATKEPYDRILGDLARPEDISFRNNERIDPANMHGIERDTWDAPQSAWLQHERQVAESILASSEVDLLIVPVQGDKNAFDPIERSLITRLVSQSLADEKSFVVANPSTVMRYFGMNRSQYPIEEVNTLARKVRARIVLVMESEHDRNGRWYLKATKYNSYENKITGSRVWTDLSYSAEYPPVFSVAGIIDEVAEFASGKDSRVSASRARFDPDGFKFPDSFDQLAEQSRVSPIYAAAYLQLVAMLHPGGAYNDVRNQLFARSLVELEKASPSSSYHRYFKARALAYLDRRVSAVGVLTEPLNRHEAALLAALNGNLPALREYVTNSGTTPLDFMALKDMQFVEAKYADRLDRDYVENFTDDNPSWAPFIYRSLLEYEDWANSSAAIPKMGLEELVPVDGDSLETFIEGKAVIGEYAEELDLVRLLWRHIDESLTPERLLRLRDIEYHTVLTEVDIAELAKSIAIADHLKEISEDLDQRKTPERALQKIAEFDPLFSGHPEVTFAKARALEAQRRKVGGAEQENLHRQYIEARLNGFSWSGTLSPYGTIVASHYRSSLGEASIRIKRHRPGGPFMNYSRRYFEWPRGAAWFDVTLPRDSNQDGVLEECLGVTWTRFGCLASQIQRESASSPDPDKVRREWLAKYSNRFIGHPGRPEFEVTLARRSGDGDAELRLLQAQVESGSRDWTIYEVLGRIYKLRGDHEAAQDVWLSYPGFTSDDGRVSVGDSHNADFVASQFYWIGQHELAIPLLKIAAGSGTGSAGSMNSAERLALIAGDLDAAISWSGERVRRYQNTYGARDLIQLLHVMGDSDLAWRLFAQFRVSQRNPEIWSGALVGHRIESASTESIAEWISELAAPRESLERARASQVTVDLGPRYLFLAGTMDRVPETDFPTLVADAHARPKGSYQNVKRPTNTDGDASAADYSRVSGKGMSFHHDPLLPNPANDQIVENGTEVEYRYEMLAQAMSAFLNGDHKDSYREFNRTAYLYYLDEFLSYFVFSAAELGRSKHLSDVIEARRINYQLRRKDTRLGAGELGEFFDEYLALAVLAAFGGQHEEAVRYLNLALNDRPFLKGRSIYPMYQIVDLADRLFEKTGTPQYRDLALELSRRHTVVLPMYAWAYFVVAKHSDARIERIKAVASGLKLDPLSERGRHLPKDLLEEGREFLEEFGPPYLSRSADDLPQTT